MSIDDVEVGELVDPDRFVDGELDQADIDELAGMSPRRRRQQERIASKYEVTDASRARFRRTLLKSKSSAFRSINPIVGYAGHNGSGKTMAMVRDAHYVMETEGRRQLSTVPLFDWSKPAIFETIYDENTETVKRIQTGPLHPLYVPLDDWMVLIEARNCDILLDEVQGVASSRGSQSLPPQLLSKFLQLRKVNCRLRWTTTNWTRVDKALREVTYALSLCASSKPDRYRAGGPWTPRLKFKVRLVDSTTLDSVETINPENGYDELGGKLVTFDVERRRRPRNEPALYDTYSTAAVMNHVSDAGWCLSCGGTRQRPKCVCARH